MGHGLEDDRDRLNVPIWIQGVYVTPGHEITATCTPEHLKLSIQ